MNEYIESVNNDLSTILIITAVIVFIIVVSFIANLVCHHRNQKKRYRIVKTADDMFRIQKYTDTNITKGNLNGHSNGQNYWDWQWLWECDTSIKEKEYDDFDEALCVVEKLRKLNKPVEEKDSEVIIKVFKE